MLLRAVAGEHAAERLDAAVEAGVVEVKGDRACFTHPLFGAAVSSRLTRQIRRSIIESSRGSCATRRSERVAWQSLRILPTPTLRASSKRRRTGSPCGERSNRRPSSWSSRRVSLPRPTRRPRGVADGRPPTTTVVRVVTGAAQALLVELESELPRALSALPSFGGVPRLSAEEAVRLEHALDEAAGAAPLTGELRRELAHVYHFLGDLSRARRHLRLAIHELEHADPRSLTTALGAHVLHETYAGQPVDDRLMARALDLERRYEQPAQMHSPTKTVALRQLQCGYFDQARSNMEEHRSMPSTTATRRRPSTHSGSSVEIACGLGRLAEAVRSAEQARRSTEQFFEPNTHLCSLLRVALAYAHVGRCDEAVALALLGEAGFAGLSCGSATRPSGGSSSCPEGTRQRRGTCSPTSPARLPRWGTTGRRTFPRARSRPRRLRSSARRPRRGASPPSSKRSAAGWGARGRSRGPRVRGLIEGGRAPRRGAGGVRRRSCSVSGISAHFDEANVGRARHRRRRAGSRRSRRTTLELAAGRFEEFGAGMWVERRAKR